MATLDFTRLVRSSRQLRPRLLMSAMARSEEGYPPYNVEKCGEHKYRIVKRANEGQGRRMEARHQVLAQGQAHRHQQAEAIKSMAAGESCWSIGKTFGVHHVTIARLAA
jgi:hypothetical protein